MKKCLTGILWLFILISLSIAQTGSIIKVKVAVASLRSQPDSTSSIVGRVPQGTLLEAAKKIGEWYSVCYMPKEEASKVCGYIHESVVELLGVEKKETAPAAPPARQPAAAEREGPVTPSAKDLDQLQMLERRIRQNSISSLSLIKKMEPSESSKVSARSVDMVRIIKDGCSVYETMDTRSRVIFRPRINDELELLEHNDGFTKILLKDRRNGWIAENCVQVFGAKKTEPEVKFRGVGSAEIKQFLETASDLFAQISQDKIVADQVIVKVRGGAAKAGSEFEDSYARIEKYYDYALTFYQRFVENKAVDLEGKPSILAQLSAWTELLFGSSSFETQYLNDPSDKSSGGIRDLSLGGNLVLNNSSRVDFQVANKRDIIQTPYGTTDVNAGYTYSNPGKLTFRAGVNLNTYTDEYSDLNDYSRLTLKAGADYQIAPQTKFNLDYSLLQNSFANNDGNNYANHLIMAAVRMRRNPTSEMAFQLRSSLASSDSAFYKFSNVEPSFTLTKLGQDSKLNFKLLYEMFSYPDLDLRSYSRAAAQLDSTKSSGDKSKSYNLALTFKNFPKNSDARYFQVSGRYAASTVGRTTSTFSPSFYTTLFTGNTANSFTDFRLDLSRTALVLFSEFSVFFKLWHSPGGKDKDETVKPHVLDLTARLGVNTKYLKIGPSFGMHALISSEEGVEFLRRDGNLIRFGGFVDGTIPLPRGISLTLNGSYEYGFVYNNEISIDTYTGEITEGDIQLRHPTTFQLNSMITVPVFRTFEILGRLNFYQINTDMDSKLSINPVTANKRFTFLVGLRYRYN